MVFKCHVVVMSEASSRSHLIVEARVRSWNTACEICVGQHDSGTAFYPNKFGLSLSLFSYHCSICMFIVSRYFLATFVVKQKVDIIC